MFSRRLSSGFQNVVSLIQQASFSTRSLKPIGLEHLHGAAGDAVGLAATASGPALLLDDAGLDVGKRGELRRQRQPGRAAADDQDVDLVRDGACGAGRGIRCGGIGNLGIAGHEIHSDGIA